MTRILSITAAAALLASSGIALAQTTNYSIDRYSTDRSLTTRSYQPTYQTHQTNRSGTSQTEHFGSSQPERFGTSQFDRSGTTRTERFGAAPMSGSTTEPRTAVRERNTGMTGNQFASESEARARCGNDVVWVNTKSRVYHFPGSPEFGHTKHGAFMCQADADRSGRFRAAKNEMRGGMGNSGGTTAPARNSFMR
jgi:hypothetical protein